MNRLSLPLLCLALAPGLSLAGPDADKTRRSVDALIKPVIASGEVVGLSVGVLQADGRAWFRGYGQRSREDTKAPQETDLLEIGSISKAFTGAILAEMVAKGEVRLDDLVTKYLPKVEIAINGRAITLLDLATHSSGLPRMPTNFAPKDFTNPYADYEAKQLYEFLRGVKPERAPGAKYEYSNLGMGLLGHALALAAKQPSYEALLKARVCVPLGLKDTTVTLDAAAKRRVVPGHDGSGNQANNWDIPLLAGAGGIRSNAVDMIALLRACLSGKGPVPDALRAAATKRRDIGPAQGIGLAWHVNTKTSIVWHNGQTGGYHGFAGWDPQAKVAVILLSNSANGLITRLGVQVMAALQGRKPKALKLFKAVPVAEAILQRYVGKYQLKSGAHIVISRRGTRLFGKGPNGPRSELLAESTTVFRIKGQQAGKVSFVLDSKGKVKELLVRLGGRNIRAPRVK